MFVRVGVLFDTLDIQHPYLLIPFRSQKQRKGIAKDGSHTMGSSTQRVYYVYQWVCTIPRKVSISLEVFPLLQLVSHGTVDFLGHSRIGNAETISGKLLS